MGEMTAQNSSQAFQDAWEEFCADKSTEFLIRITADRCGVEYSNVVDALATIHEQDKPKETDRDD